MPRSCGRGDGSLRGTVWREIWDNRDCYLYLLPFYAIFLLFVVLPVLISIFFSFTYYNVFQSPEWVGWKNYIHLLASDEVFLQAVKNTFLIALVTGPVGYFVSLMVAWLISDLRPGLRTGQLSGAVSDGQPLYDLGLYSCDRLDEPRCRISVVRLGLSDDRPQHV